MNQGGKKASTLKKINLEACMLRDKHKLQRFIDHKGQINSKCKDKGRFFKTIEKSQHLFEQRKKSFPKVSYPEELPITRAVDEIRETLLNEQVLIILGETGSGKTTQIPKICLEAGFGSKGTIACTQPRRVAALSVSRRVSDELNTKWGEQVGCKIRFQEDARKETLVKFMTDGILLAEIQSDPLLLDYELIVIDEAHERSLNIDFLLGYLKSLLQKRKDLKVIITSATIDTEIFSKTFNNAPIISVEGKTYPVEVEYRPVEEEDYDQPIGYIEQAVEIADEIVHERKKGDILIFMPTERDIRESCDLLAGRLNNRTEVLPLFGRLSASDQQKIFKSSQKQKIVIATNIAETSITIPGIRYVIDTGFARVSRYSPQTRTQRLPVEEIPQSSAKQRKGRCGRVSDGICIRLYSEGDYNNREPYAQPEILRSNLAAVILRMKAFNLGKIEEFPFIDAPNERAVRAGYNLLQDLGAMDEEKTLTHIGKRLARLPVDPTVGRMLLEAVEEGALKEVLVIAAALSIQDPRERPENKTAQADQAHARFRDKNSDFISLLNIWNKLHEIPRPIPSSKLRKFCKQNFLNFMRMREWREIHQQLERSMKDIRSYKVSAGEAEDFMIHRSLLSGLIANIARKDKGNLYRATHNRNVMLFPGSALFDKKAAARTKKKQSDAEKAEINKKSQTPAWIMCSQWLETSRLFAQNCAAIDPKWLSEFGEHLLKKNYSDPYFDKKQGSVLCREKSFLFGLEINIRRAQYGKINPEEATDIFIRTGLVEDEIRANFSFLEHNRELRNQIENWQTRLRTVSSWHLDDRIYAFYTQRLQDVSNIHSLRKLLKSKQKDEPAFLFMEEADLLHGHEHELDTESYPDAIQIGKESYNIDYNYKPGEEEDGATLKLSVSELNKLDSGLLDWAIPGFVERKAEELLRALPKEYRRNLFPIAEKIEAIKKKLNADNGSLVEQLSQILLDDYGIRVWTKDWPTESVPKHLLTRLVLVDEKDQVVVEGRNLETVKTQYEEKAKKQAEKGEFSKEEGLWKEARKTWEKKLKNFNDFIELPDEIDIGLINGLEVKAFPGFYQTQKNLSIKLYTSKPEAFKNSFPLLKEYLTNSCSKEFAWMEKDLQKEIHRVGPAAIVFISLKDLLEDSLLFLKRNLLFAHSLYPIRSERFKNLVKESEQKMRGLPQRYVDLLLEIFELRLQIEVHKNPYPTMKNDLVRILPKDFLKRINYDQLEQFPRYLNTILRRAERYKQNKIKDEEKAKRVEPYIETYRQLVKKANNRNRNLLIDYFWMIEEYKVSIYAQELGTKGKISAKKLDEIIEEIKRVC